MARVRKLYCQKHQGFFWGNRLFSWNGLMVCPNCYRSLSSIRIVNTKDLVFNGIMIGLAIAVLFALVVRFHSDDFQKEWRSQTGKQTEVRHDQ